MAIFTERNKRTTDILDPRRTVIVLLFNYAEMIFWFVVCYSILQAKGQLELADGEGPKAIILLRESLMSMVAHSSDAFDDKSKLAWFVMLVQNVVGLIMTIVIATRFISFLPQAKSMLDAKRKRQTKPKLEDKARQERSHRAIIWTA